MIKSIFRLILFITHKLNDMYNRCIISFWEGEEEV